VIVDVETFLSAAPQTIYEHALRPALLLHIAAPLVRFRSLEPSGFPPLWTDGEQHKVDMRLFGLLPIGRQTIHIDLTQHDPDELLLRDRGSGQLVRTWDHLISLSAQGDGALYRDNVRIEAGALTPFIWLFAAIFYRWRQHRWRALVRRGFAY
jgi:hypothetical protein